MAFVFNSDQLQKIQDAVDEISENNLDNWELAYNAVVEVLGDALASGMVAPEDRSYVDAVHVWFKGAVMVNTGQGVFSKLIRTYTKRQLELHTGNTYLEQDIADLMQTASNAIAGNVIVNEILSEEFGHKLPELSEIADRDATQALSIVFKDIESNDSGVNAANGGGAAWSGSILFSMFSQPGSLSDESYRLLSVGDKGSFDTVDDFRNILFAFEAFSVAAKEVVTSLAKFETKPLADDLLIFADLLSVDRGSWENIYEEVMEAYEGALDLAGPALMDWSWNTLLSQMMKGSLAHEAFSHVADFNIYELVDKLGELYGFDFGTVDADDFRTNAHHIFDEIKSQGDLNTDFKLLCNVSVSDLFNEAENSIGYRYALHSLSPFVLGDDISAYSDHNSNGQLDLYDQNTGKGQLTIPYLQDRAEMLYLLIEKTISGSQPRHNESSEYYDFESGTIVSVDSVSNSQVSRRYMFGSEAGESIEGGGESDHLYGMDGMDILTGNKGDDYLEGGLGADEYVFYYGDGNDFIFDISAGNSITIESETITSLEGVSYASDIFINEDEDIQLVKFESGFVITYKDASGKVGTVTVENAEVEDFGITLSDYKEEVDEPEIPSDILIVGDGDLDNDGDIHPDWIGFGNLERSDEVNSKSIHFDASLISDEHPEFENGGRDINWLFVGGYNDDILISESGASPVFNRPMLHGHDGNDTIKIGAIDWGLAGGGNGDDFLEHSGGDIYLFGDEVYFDESLEDDGDGSDTLISHSEGAKTMDGGGGDDYLISTEIGDAALAGGSGSDFIQSGDGNDNLFGDGRIYVESSFDEDGKQVGYIFSYRLQDIVDQNKNYNDVIDAGNGNNSVWGGAGEDTIIAGDGNDEIWGDIAHADALTNWQGSLGQDVPVEMHGADLIYSGAGDDLVIGGGGDDVIYAGAGDDRISGDDGWFEDLGGNDYINGEAGDDTIYGGNGEDTLLGDSGEDFIAGGEGNDRIEGGADNDKLYGEDGDDTLFGGEGDDKLQGAKGNDYLEGGDGNDHIQDYWNTDTSEYNILLGGAGADVLLSGNGSDWLDGGSGSDYLFGGVGDDTLIGGSENDVLVGGNGNDWIAGGHGRDYMFGGYGNDTYSLSAGDGLDDIIDYSGNNEVYIDGASLDTANLYQYGSALLLIYGDNNAVSIKGDSIDIYLNGEELTGEYIASNLQYQALNIGTRIANNRSESSQSSTFSTGSSVVGSSALFASTGTGSAFAQSTVNDDSTAESGTTFMAWYAGQLISVDASTEGVDPIDPSTWLQRGAISLTGALTYYTSDSGEVMAGVPAEDGSYLVPAGATMEHILLPDGTLLSHEPSFATESNLVATPGEDLDLPEGAVGDTSGISADDEIIDGTSSDDTLSGGTGMDLISGESGVDTIDGGEGDDIVFGGEGSDVLSGSDGNDFLYGGEGADNVQGGEGDDYIAGDAGDDNLQGGNGNDLLIGGEGNDTLSGGAGSDKYYFGLNHGQDIIDNSSDTGFSTIAFSDDISPYRMVVTRSGDDLILENSDTGDTVSITNYFASDASTVTAIDQIEFYGGDLVWSVDDIKAMVLIGDDADNIIKGYNNSNDILEGGSGNDYLIGGAGDDSLEGGYGDDVLEGGSGDDVYLVGANGGHDQIIDLSSENNQLQFSADILPESVKAIRSENDLVLSVVDGDSSVTITDYFDSSGEKISTISFTDGTNWDVSQVKQLVLTGTTASETISGYESDDIINGEQGNDTLIGNGGSDTYLFSLGDGQDQIITGEQDIATTETVRFDETVSESSVAVERSGDDLVIRYSANDAVTVKDFFVNEGFTGSAVDRVEFSSGAIWTLEDLKAKVLLGDSESNTIEAYSSDDLLIGNGGDDTLIGGSGSDTYQFSIGDGSDLITDSAGDQDRIDFTDVNPEDVLLRRDGTDLLITNVSTSDTIRVRDQFATAAGAVSVSGVNSIAFANGSVWDYEQIKQSVLAGTDEADEIFGHADADTIDAGKGDDTIYGAIGNDIISGGEGADQIYGEDGDDDLYGGEGNDYLDGGSGFSRLYGDTGDDTLIGSGELSGGDGNDILNGQGSDLLIGGTGNDELKGLAESDVYRFSMGDGVDHIDDQGGDSDRLEFTDVNPEDLVLRRDGNDLVITNSVSGDSIRITDQFSSQTESVAGSGIDSIVFADSTSWNYEEIKQQALLGTDGTDSIYGHADDDTIVAGSGSDIVYGQNGDDVISGAAGQDQLFGGIGNDEIHGGEDADTIYGNSGDDQLYGDEGNDVIEDYSGANTIYGGEGNDQLSGNGTLSGDAGADTLTGSGLLDGGEGNDIINGEGSDTLIGGAGDDVISAYSYYGTQNNNILEGGTGNDTLYGSFGDDEYRFNLGDGQDILTERRYGEDSSDIDPSSDSIRFGAGISQVDLKFERHGNDMLIAHSNGSDSIRVTDWFSGLTDHHKINEIIFDDGSTLDLAQIESRVITYGTSGDDTLWGYRELSEHLIGGEGDDRYVYYPGGGQDVIDNTGGGEDWLFFNGGIGRDRLSFQREGDDLLILVDEDSEQSVRILNHFLGGDYAIDYVQPNGDDPLNQEFALTGSEINQIVAAGSSDFDAVIEGTSSDDENLQGTSGNDQVNGLEGNDTLFGMAGDDEILGGEGDDYLSGGTGHNSNSGNDTLYGEDGDDILFGEDGDDFLAGGSGNDQYHIYTNNGVDTIDNTGGGTDLVLFWDGITHEQLSFHQDGIDLLILIDSDMNQKIRVLGHFEGGEKAISAIWSDNGTYSISAANITNLLVPLPTDNGGTDNGGTDNGGIEFDSVIEGTANSEQLLGTSDNDQISGFAGSDTLYGFGGDDELLGGADADTLVGGNGSGSGSGKDTLYGGEGDDQMYGEDESDTLDGGDGSDWLVGGDGDDLLYGGNDNDILSGEGGNDILVGGLGDDDYYFGINGGVDTIDNTGGGTDWIMLTDGITREQLSFHQDGDDLVILIDSDLNQQLRVQGHFLGGDNAISYVQPNDGGSAIPASSIPGLLAALPTSDVVASSNFMASALVEPSQEEVAECDGFEVGVDESSIVTSDSALQADMTDSLVNAMAAFGGEPMGESQFSSGSQEEVETVIACNFQVA
ncbi:hypothetical protein BTJ40_15525 [Microbulbifer sp. A4B17]|uniref:calcium-binding protein n=1 Tax=Microbulbifer sp. A4B17 TaxID=359370 RepID=UPI000D52E276|nr:calcium-binding protein [Microbulbifer sp. A4B17]AWF82128.1 hypothetical protein BTJ40_15525 [Microbulbifer sp. A4B17]